MDNNSDDESSIHSTSFDEEENNEIDDGTKSSVWRQAPSFWTPKEDELLRSVVEKYGPKNWRNIAEKVPGRNHVQCLQRWNKVLKPGLKKGAWTQEEDDALIEVVTRLGLQDSHGDEGQMKLSVAAWGNVALAVPGRTAKQCRERWRLCLDPRINKQGWSEEEDQLLLSLQREVGNRWALIARTFPGRTENAVKSRARSLSRLKYKEWTPDEDEILLKQKELDKTWEEICSSLSKKRSKNACITRYKLLKSMEEANKITMITSSSSSSSFTTNNKNNYPTTTTTASPRLASSSSAPDNLMIGLQTSNDEREVSTFNNNVQNYAATVNYENSTNVLMESQQSIPIIYSSSIAQSIAHTFPSQLGKRSISSSSSSSNSFSETNSKRLRNENNNSGNNNIQQEGNNKKEFESNSNNDEKLQIEQRQLPSAMAVTAPSLAIV